MNVLGRTCGVGLAGIDGEVVEVEADVATGLPGFLMGGLPDAACRQAAERVKSAVVHSGFDRLECKVVVNLSPASQPKTGAGFDLAIALAVLVARGDVAGGAMHRMVHIGELGLDGSLRPVPGVLARVLGAVASGRPRVVVPLACAAEASLVAGAEVFAVASLAEAAALHTAMRKNESLAPWAVEMSPPDAEIVPAPRRDLADVAGQEEARLALEIAAAGGHHVFMLGPPGAGKTMLAECLPGLLPRLTDEEALEATVVHSVLSELQTGALIRVPPFVAPHHGASAPALVGGSGQATGGVRPGLITLAHNGVLFLDEAPEFKPGVLQALRQPLESGSIVVARARGSATFPARFQLVLAANPCPCGNSHGKGADCRCAAKAKRDYLGRLAGPLLDRIDVQLQVDRVSRAALALPRGEASSVVAARVREARAVQADRLRDTPWRLNSHVPGPRLRHGRFRLPSETTSVIDRALDRGTLTLRGYDRVLRLAWSAADLAGTGTPGPDDVGLAFTLRTRAGMAA